jgi:hypothetical protein
MSALTNYLENKLTDAYWRGQPFTMPAAHYFGLLLSTKGPRANSTVYALNDTISLTANDGKTHLYKCTTAGTTAAAQSTLYPGVNDEAITDGTAVFTEQNAALEAGTALVEPAGGSYARVGVAASLANFAGTQAAASTTASTGTNGTTSNNAAIIFPAPTAAWGFVWGMATYDAASAGNPLTYVGLATVKTVNNGDAAPSFAAAAYTHQFDN